MIAVTPDPGVARWASQPIDLGDGMMFRPRVIGPEGITQVTDLLASAPDYVNNGRIGRAA
jgi:hypothetical protein